MFLEIIEEKQFSELCVHRESSQEAITHPLFS